MPRLQSSFQPKELALESRNKRRDTAPASLPRISREYKKLLDAPWEFFQIPPGKLANRCRGAINSKSVSQDLRDGALCPLTWQLSGNKARDRSLTSSEIYEGKMPLPG